MSTGRSPSTLDPSKKPDETDLTLAPDKICFPEAGQFNQGGQNVAYLTNNHPAIKFYPEKFSKLLSHDPAE